MKKNQCVNRMIEINSHVGGIYMCVCDLISFFFFGKNLRFNFKLLEQLFIISINISK